MLIFAALYSLESRLPEIAFPHKWVGGAWPYTHESLQFAPVSTVCVIVLLLLPGNPELKNFRFGGTSCLGLFCFLKP